MVSGSRHSEDKLRWEVSKGIGHLTIDNPEARNALSWDMRDTMADLLIEASASLDVRVVVLSGTGKGFCTGAQLGGPTPERRPKPDGAPERVVGDAARMIRNGWGRLISSVLDCEKPVVAAVNGVAAGGGAHLALASDLVIMAEDARIIEVFVRRGIIPDAGGCYLLPRIIGLQKAKELMFFGDDVSAHEAERIGLVNKVVPPSELQATAAEWAERLATLPTKAIGMTKWLLNRSFESTRTTAFEEESFAQELVGHSQDSGEGMRAFIERRSAEFKGW
jgi:2-(1,2-epoxy-1,2-dihydrophenyl)acetyl-CoA isomerase